MQTLDEKAKVNQYPYNSKFGMWAVEITEHISRNWFKKGYELCQKECEEKLRWIPVEEKVPEASPDKNDWWTSDIGEVFPYSKKCIIENDEGEFFINNYSVIENCWGTFCGTIVKWRFL